MQHVTLPQSQNFPKPKLLINLLSVSCCVPDLVLEGKGKPAVNTQAAAASLLEAGPLEKERRGAVTSELFELRQTTQPLKTSMYSRQKVGHNLIVLKCRGKNLMWERVRGT